MNSVNVWQSASQRSNCDFKPLVDHLSALEYSVKYDSKPEKGSQSLGKLMAFEPVEKIPTTNPYDDFALPDGVLASIPLP